MNYAVFVLGVNSFDEFSKRDFEVALTEFILNDRMSGANIVVRFVDMSKFDILHKDPKSNFSIDAYEKISQRCDVVIILAAEECLNELTILSKNFRESGCKDVRCRTVSKPILNNKPVSFSLKRKKDK